MTIKRLVNNWPDIELYFTVQCNGQPSYTFDRNQNFILRENGYIIDSLSLWCADPNVRCPVSIAMIFDASGSMVGTRNEEAIAAGNAFISLMDGVVDEAAVIWFTSAVHIQQSMTIKKSDLHDAVNGLPSNGATAVWDGIYVGLSELINSGNNKCRAVIVLSDGGDNSSTHSVDDCISLANRHRIRIFTLGIAEANGSELEHIANMTGGRYYPVNTEHEFTSIFQEISSIVFAGFEDCVITYRAQCADGAVRNVSLTLTQFCNGSDTATVSYTARKDTSLSTPLDIRVGTCSGKGGSYVRVPIELKTDIQPAGVFEKANIELEFDSSCIELSGIETPPGTLLHGVPITVDYIAGGVSITTTSGTQILGHGTLAELVFKLSDPDVSTTCPVRVHTFDFNEGCFRAVVKDGGITIKPREPDIECTIEMPVKLEWQPWMNDYSANPFQVRCRVFNKGDREARRSNFTFVFDPAVVSSIVPQKTSQTGIPLNVAAGDESEAYWIVRIAPQIADDSVEFCFTATFDNHQPVTCCAKIWVPRMRPALDTECNVPGSLTWNDTTGAYAPNPFTVKLSVRNTGNIDLQNVTASLELPSEVVFDPAAQQQTVAVGNVAQWKPGNSFPVAEWSVRYIGNLAGNVPLKFRFSTSGETVSALDLDTVYSECVTVASGIQQQLECALEAPDTLKPSAGGANVEPNPFRVTYTITNPTSSIAVVQSVELQLMQSSGLSIHASSPNPRTIILNRTLLPGDALTLEWIVLATNSASSRDVYVQATAHDSENNEIWCGKQIVVSALKPRLSCALTTSENPIIYDRQLQVYTNPNWTVRAELFNSGGVDLTNVSAELSIVNDPLGLVEFDQAYAAQDKNPVHYPALNAGQILHPEWHIRLAKPNSSGVSQFVDLSVSYSSTEIPEVVRSCDIQIEIQPVLPRIKRREVPPSDSTSTVRTSLDDEPVSSLQCILEMPDSLGYSSDGMRLTPNPFEVRLRLHNPTSNDINVKSVELFFAMDGIDLDPASLPKRRNCGLIAPGQDVVCAWILRAADRFHERWIWIQADGIEAGGGRNTCRKRLRIPSRSPQLSCSIMSDQYRVVFSNQLNEYTRSPWQVSAILTNTADYDLSDVSVWMDIAEDRFSLVEPHQPVVGNPHYIKQIPSGGSETVSWWYRLAQRNTTGESQRVIYTLRYRIGQGEDVMGDCMYDIEIRPMTAQGGIDSIVVADTVATERSESAFRRTGGSRAVQPYCHPETCLYQNSPNPFNPVTSIEYSVRTGSRVFLAVYNVLGVLAQVLVDEYKEAGKYRVSFDGSALPGGVYVCRLEAGTVTRIRRMILAK